jgi:replicative DNA helicase
MDYCKKGPSVAASGAKDNFSFIVSKTTYTVNKLPDFFTRKMTALAGGEIPPKINTAAFLIPRHRLIFNALHQLARLGLLRKWDDNLPRLEALLKGANLLKAAGGKDFLYSLCDVCGIPAMTNGLALVIIELHARRRDYAANTKY